MIEEEQINSLSTVRALSRLITRQKATYTANINFYEALCEWLSRGKERNDFSIEKLRELVLKEKEIANYKEKKKKKERRKKK